MINRDNSYKGLRYGYTTGSCAAGAAKGAAFGLINGYIPDHVEIDTPAGKTIRLEILDKQLGNDFAECCVKKDSGDDPDVTNGALIYCRLQIADWGLKRQNKRVQSANPQSISSNPRSGIKYPWPKIHIKGGRGVGIVTRPGLQVKVGQHAINPVPRLMIKRSLSDIFGKDNDYSLKAVISVPEGEDIAKHTFNNRLGIVGGISIIGTTGLVKPMSEESIKASLRCELDIAKAMGFKTIILVPGSIGETSVKKNLALRNSQVVLMSNFVGFMLKSSQDMGFKKIILAGHPGKLAKLIEGYFDTHSSRSRMANEIIIELLQKEAPTNKRLLGLIKGATTVEGIIQLVKRINKSYIFDNIAEMIEDAASAFLEDKVEIGVMLFDMEKQLVGLSAGARRMKDDL